MSESKIEVDVMLPKVDKSYPVDVVDWALSHLEGLRDENLLLFHTFVTCAKTLQATGRMMSPSALLVELSLYQAKCLVDDTGRIRDDVADIVVACVEGDMPNYRVKSLTDIHSDACAHNFPM